ncbi:hypothetical protein [Pseudomonas cremoricolorata]|uniref:hypothetical protein n=1 Tax=Pseudomonas cremoricolorata TaxID=157783 RepID=UPI000421BFE4|nr:hypothetical protein [Pseudomonas cremoricolorata]
MSIDPTPAEPALTPPAPDAAPLPWADLACEHFLLLRLSPQPTERTGPRPLRFVQLGHAERYSKTHALLRMQISLPGQLTHKEKNQVDVRVDHAERAVQIGAALQLEPINRGLGRFLLAKAARWLQQRWPDYRVQGLELASNEVLSDDARQRRDHLLRAAGLDVSYADGPAAKARVLDAAVSQLRPHWNEDKVQVLPVLDTAALLQQAEQQLQELTVQLRERDERVARVEREDSGLRFTITCLVAFAVFQAGLLIFIATR